MASAFGAQATVAFGGLATVLGALVMARLVPSLLTYRTTPAEVRAEEAQPA